MPKIIESVIEPIKPLPKWLMTKYAKLWCSFKNNPFTSKEVNIAFGNDFKYGFHVLSLLKRMGWLVVSLHSEDSRRHVYTLIGPEEAVQKLSQIEGEK